MLSFAGLYDFWRDPSKADDDPDLGVVSAAIITCAATGPAGEAHDRTPVILPDDRVGVWLDPKLQDPRGHGSLPTSSRRFGVRAVATLVNSVKNDGPELILPLEARNDAEIQLSVAA